MNSQSSTRAFGSHTGSRDTVSVGIDATVGTGYSGLTDAAVFAPDGSEIQTTINSNTDRARFETDGQGTHAVRLTYATQSGDSFVESVRVQAGESSRNSPPTLRVSEGVGGPLGIVGDGLASSRVSVDDSDVELTAQLGANDRVPSVLHVHPQTVMRGSQNEIDVSVVRGDDEDTVREHVSLNVHLTDLDDDALLWRDGDPITRDGQTRYGEV